MKENEDLIVSAALARGLVTEADLEDCRRTLHSLREFGIDKSLLDALIEHRLLNEEQLAELSGGRYIVGATRADTRPEVDPTRLAPSEKEPQKTVEELPHRPPRPNRSDMSFASRSFADPSPISGPAPDGGRDPFAMWPDPDESPSAAPPPPPDQTLDFTEAEIAALLEDEFPDQSGEISRPDASYFDESSSEAAGAPDPVSPSTPAPMSGPPAVADMTAPAPSEEGPAGATMADAAPLATSGQGEMTRAAPQAMSPAVSQLSPARSSSVPGPEAGPSASDHLVGQTVGGCRLEAELGRGAMGTVYKATHLALQKTVALKVLNPARFYDERQVEQFFAEARAAAAIEHHNIVGVHDVGQENGLYFIVMQYIEGGSVADRLKLNKRLKLDDAIRIGIQAARGLAVAHAKGIVHRDIKPANLMLTESSEVKIADFGLAYRAEEEANVSGGPEVMGTPSYMSPEQIDGRSVDQRADLYSLGVTLYLLTTGRKPFEGSTPMEVLLKHVSEKLKPPTQYNQEIPQALGQVIERLMAKQPDNRYSCAEDLIQDLEEILQGGKPKVVVAMEDVIQRMEELAKSETAPVRDRRPVLAAAVSGIAAAVCAILFTIALPEIRGASAFSSLEQGNRIQQQGETAVADAVAFANANPGQINEIREVFRKVQESFPSPIPAKAAMHLRGATSRYDDLAKKNAKEALETCARLRGESDFVGATLALDEIDKTWLAGEVGREIETLRERLKRDLAKGTGMTLVPAGNFLAGPDAHEEFVGAFLVDILEVSNTDYAEFVAATSHPVPEHWPNGEIPAGEQNLPVVGVRHSDAKAYAEWKGGRLPTGLEWEKAARGTDGREYPWGDEFRGSFVNCRQTLKGQIRPTRSAVAGASPFGCLNIVGNVHEWTDSVDPETGYPVARGGAYLSYETNVRTFSGIPVDPDHHDPKLPVGFRIVKDVE